MEIKKDGWYRTISLEEACELYGVISGGKMYKEAPRLPYGTKQLTAFDKKVRVVRVYEANSAGVREVELSFDEELDFLDNFSYNSDFLKPLKPQLDIKGIYND